MYMDSAKILVDTSYIYLSEIKKIYMPEKRYGFRLLKQIAIRGTLAFIAISATNRAINNDGVVVDDRTLKITSVGLAAYLFCELFDYKKQRLNKNNYVDVIEI